MTSNDIQNNETTSNSLFKIIYSEKRESIWFICFSFITMIGFPLLLLPSLEELFGYRYFSMIFIMGTMSMWYLLIMQNLWHSICQHTITSFEREFGLWKGYRSKNLKNTASRNLENYKYKSRYLSKLGIKLSGFSIKKDNSYYLEKSCEKIKLYSLKIFRERILNSIFSCLGVTYLIILLVSLVSEYIFQINFYEGYLFLRSIVIVGCFSPILIFWLDQSIWLIKDSSIRLIESKNIVIDLGEKMRSGVILRKFLGIGGLLTGIGIAGRYASISVQVKSPLFIFYYYLEIVRIIAISTCTIAIVWTLGVMNYLGNQHEKNVNHLRKILSNYLPLGSINIDIIKKPPITPVKIESRMNEKPSKIKLSLGGCIIVFVFYFLILIIFEFMYT